MNKSGLEPFSYLSFDEQFSGIGQVLTEVKGCISGLVFTYFCLMSRIIEILKEG